MPQFYNSLPDPIRVDLSNVEPDGSRYFVRILTLVIFGELGLCGLEERRFASIVQAQNENIEVVLLRPLLPQSRYQRVHIAVHVHAFGQRRMTRTDLYA